jgi:hypothetical protein
MRVKKTIRIEGCELIYLAYYDYQRRALVNTIMNLHPPLMLGIS